MLVACRLAGLSALGAHYGVVNSPEHPCVSLTTLVKKRTAS
jgi:hypothetical protein